MTIVLNVIIKKVTFDTLILFSRLVNFGQDKIKSKKDNTDMTTDQNKSQTKTNKPGTYTQTGFNPKAQTPKKSITLWDIVTGKA
jgi:hypothetical protein